MRIKIVFPRQSCNSDREPQNMVNILKSNIADTETSLNSNRSRNSKSGILEATDTAR